MKDYDPKNIEPKWQAEWEKRGIYRTKDQWPGKDNEMVLVEFAYPSGNLHVGHWYAFSVTDVYARYRRMLGKNVMFPFGFDAFGLPAENAAIQRKLNPKTWTYENIDYMKKQLASMGTMFDWQREVVTSDPSYYKWTQWLFLQLFKKGLAYQSEREEPWCPKDKTVLAREQVIDGKCERCGTEVVNKKLLQWSLRITDYADRLVDDLEKLHWPTPIKEAQRNWIGRSEGVEIEFEFVPSPNNNLGEDSSIKIFTTRPDTIYGATFVAVSGPADKFTGRFVINPATKEEIPVWEAEYVLADYGTGAIMGVPADDERDNAFALKHNLPIKEGYKKAGVEDFGRKVTKYKLHDWGISRQRYWGCPIPVIICDQCGPQAVPESELPVILPETEDFLPRDDGKSPLSKVSDWVNVKCPKCGAKAHRESDTLDTFMDSSWYFLRYADPHNTESFADKEKLKQWIPVDFYSGGAEHTTMHLLYSRFFHKALFDLGLVREEEPFVRRMNRGLILGPDGNKMSKSKGNVIDPDDYVQRLGADTVRMYLAFIGPYNEVGAYPWNPDSIVGVRRFLERVWRIKNKLTETDSVGTLLHQTIKTVTHSLETLKMNTGVAALMTLTNELDRLEQVATSDYKTLLQLLAPFAPHMAEELWSDLGQSESIHLSEWPKYDESKLVAGEATFAVQINGKLRGTFVASTEVKEAEALEIAKALPEVAKWLQGGEVSKVIFVPKKLINLVVSNLKN